MYPMYTTNPEAWAVATSAFSLCFGIYPPAAPDWMHYGRCVASLVMYMGWCYMQQVGGHTQHVDEGVVRKYPGAFRRRRPKRAHPKAAFPHLQSHVLHVLSYHYIQLDIVVAFDRTYTITIYCTPSFDVYHCLTHGGYLDANFDVLQNYSHLSTSCVSTPYALYYVHRDDTITTFTTPWVHLMYLWSWLKLRTIYVRL
jgi:hypothetical protein